MIARRCHGYIAEPGYKAHGPHPLVHAPRSAAEAPFPAAAALSKMYARMRNQGQAGTCLLFAGGAAIQDRMAIQGTQTPAFPEPLWGYQARPDKMVDSGLAPSTWVEFDAAAGYCKEGHWPYPTGADLDDPKAMLRAIQQGPPAEAARFAYDQRTTSTNPGLRLHRAGDTPLIRMADIKRAVIAGLPLVTGGDVDDAYEAYSSGLWAFIGPSIGGHAQEIVAYDSAGIWWRGSYSDSFGIAPGFETVWLADDGTTTAAPRGGFVHAAWDDVLNAEITNDVWIVDWAPSFSEDVPAIGGAS